MNLLGRYLRPGAGLNGSAKPIKPEGEPPTMKNPTAAIFAKAVKMSAQPNVTIPQILEATGLNYSQYWCHTTRLEIVGTDQDFSKLAAEALAKPQNADGSKSPAMIAFEKQIVACRQAGDSWGLIGVKFNRPESLVRRHFKENAGIHSVGLRIGKGGRWAQDDQVLYNGDRKYSGIDLKASLKRNEWHAEAVRRDAEATAKAEKAAAAQARAQEAKAARAIAKKAGKATKTHDEVVENLEALANVADAEATEAAKQADEFKANAE